MNTDAALQRTADLLQSSHGRVRAAREKEDLLRCLSSTQQKITSTQELIQRSDKTVDSFATLRSFPGTRDMPS
jgi:hypothetical protein